MATKREPYQKLLKAFGIMKAPTSEENAARWNQAAREWKQQADEHYEEEAPKFAEAGIPESAARYHTGRDSVQYQSDASLRSDPAFKRVREDIEPSEREGFTDRVLARERENQKEGTKRSLDQTYPGDSLKHMEKASILKAFRVLLKAAERRTKRQKKEDQEKGLDRRMGALGMPAQGEHFMINPELVSQSDVDKIGYGAPKSLRIRPDARLATHIKRGVADLGEERKRKGLAEFRRGRAFRRQQERKEA